MSSDGFPYPVDRPGNFAERMHAERAAAEAREPHRSVAERCEILAVALHDRGETQSAQLLWDADARIREIEAENARLRHVAQSRYELLRECQTEFKALGSKGLVETIEAALART
jgi:hypothetical protein